MINPFSGIVTWVLGLALVGALLLNFHTAHERDEAYVHVAQTQTTLANERSGRARDALTASEAYRKLEQQRAAQAQEIDRALLEAKNLRTRNRDLERAGHDRVRSDIGAFLAIGSGGSQTCPAELSAERDKSATLGDLLGEADRQAGEFADAAERHADEARALKAQLEADRRSQPGATTPPSTPGVQQK